MRNLALRLRYDGSAYHGWQRQKDLITVQQAVEEAVEKTCGEKVHVTGCGRTDAGVHALRYCANFRAAAPSPPIVSPWPSTPGSRGISPSAPPVMWRRISTPLDHVSEKSTFTVS